MLVSPLNERLPSNLRRREIMVDIKDSVRATGPPRSLYSLGHLDQRTSRRFARLFVAVVRTVVSQPFQKRVVQQKRRLHRTSSRRSAVA
jgi:hypothetical protein